MRNGAVIVLLVAATAAAAAQQPPGQPPQATGTGTITGRVVEAATGTPVAGARLWIQQTSVAAPIGVYPRSEEFTTDSDGAFAFRNLPAGQFSIAAHADGYQSGAIGKHRPEGEEASITLKDGQTFSHATIELFRGGTISGIVTNDRGEPMKEVQVDTWLRTGNGRLKKSGNARTDAAGLYRITPVAAGDHFVVAQIWHNTVRQRPAIAGCFPPPPPPPPGTPPRPAVVEKPEHAEGDWFISLPHWIPEPAPDDRGQPRTVATTIYPGVSEVSQATAVSIRAGEDRSGIDLQLRPTATAIVQGRIVPLADKKIPKGSEVRLRLPGAPSDVAEHVTWVQPDNTFRFLGVPPASYVLELQLQEFDGCDSVVRQNDDVLTQMPVDVPAGGFDDLVVPVTAGFTMQGRIRFDGKTPRPEVPYVWLTPASGGEGKTGTWDGDGRIMVGGLVPDPYALQVSQNGEPGWFVRSMTLGERDLVTRPMAIDRDEVSGVDVTMTDRPSPLDGSIVDAAGDAVRDATVVVFPADRTTWPTAHDHLLAFARTRSLDGTYRFAHLVPGDYLIAALDERRMGDWPRAEFLEAIAKQASPVRIGPGEPRTLKLILQTR